MLDLAVILVSGLIITALLHDRQAVWLTFRYRFTKEVITVYCRNRAHAENYWKSMDQRDKELIEIVDVE